MKLAKLGDGPEIFHTLQGEGPSTGMPAVFLRTSRCNLHCPWCDTDHTWNFIGTPWPHEKDADPAYRKHDRADVTIDLTPQQAADLLLAYHCPRFIITGGEPLLQQAELREMIHLLRSARSDTVIEVETNGTRLPESDFADVVDQFNVSPKLSHTAMPGNLRIVSEALSFFASTPKAWFKWVVRNEADLAEVESLVSSHGIDRSRVLLMPEGRTPAELNASAPLVAELCKRHGYRFSDRLHIRLWGDKRGV